MKLFFSTAADPEGLKSAGKFTKNETWKVEKVCYHPDFYSIWLTLECSILQLVEKRKYPLYFLATLHLSDEKWRQGFNQGSSGKQAEQRMEFIVGRSPKVFLGHDQCERTF